MNDIMRVNILGMDVDAVSYDDVIDRVGVWYRGQRDGKYVCLANVHMVMECWDSDEVRAAVNKADIVAPDGMPLVWVLRRKAHRLRSNVRGATLMLKLCEWAACNRLAVGFFGGGPGIADTAAKNLRRQFPRLKVAYKRTPPFFSRPRPDDEVAADINVSGVAILFVGLGCPKQELWMSLHAGMVKATMVGVGAAFDFHAGAMREAPEWMQKQGLEWAFRLASEPRRLWRRYLIQNSRFIFHLAKESARIQRR